MPAPAINLVWERIENCAGQEFQMIRGAAFLYKASGGHVLPDRTNQQIPKSHFEKALQFVPLTGTTSIQDLRGPSFIYAILMDSRIRQTDW
jgi:hypothetical protein